MYKQDLHRKYNVYVILTCLTLPAILPAVCIFDFLADFPHLPILMFQIVTAVLLSPGKDFPAENDSVMSAVTVSGLSWLGRLVKWGLVGITVKM